MHRSTLAIAAALLAATLAATSSAQFPGGAPDGDPSRRPIEAPRFRKRTQDQPAQGTPTLEVIGRDGTVRPVAGGELPPAPADFAAAFSPGAGALAAPGTATLVLSDGQRLPGALDVDGGMPVWVSPWVAPRPVDLGSVRALVFPGGRQVEAVDADVIELRNGDRVTGAIASILPEKITVERGIGDGAERLDVAMRDVLSIGIVGTDAPWAGVRAWLHDGTVINAAGADWLGSEHLRFPSIRGAKLPVASVPRRMVVAIQSDPSSVLPLAAMPVEAVHPDGIAPERRRESIAVPVLAEGTWPLDAPPFEVEGPVVLRFEGIAKPSILSCTLVRPAAARAAGSPSFAVRSGGKEVVREPLGPGRASVGVRAPLGPGPFEIELSTPDGSIAGCFAVLRQALVLPAP